MNVFSTDNMALSKPLQSVIVLETSIFDAVPFTDTGIITSNYQAIVGRLVQK